MTTTSIAHTKPTLAPLQAGERVTVHIAPSDPEDMIESWHGVIVAIDGLGLRLRAEWARLGPCTDEERGVWFWPWRAIESVEIAEVSG